MKTPLRTCFGFNTTRGILAGAMLGIFVVSACGTTSSQSEPPVTAATSGTPATNVEPERAEPPRAMLSDSVTPLAYTLHFNVVPTEERFGGQADIRVRFSEATQSFFMHGEGLAVASVSVLAGEQVIAAHFEQRSEDGVAEFRTETPIPAGEATLHFEYTAEFNHALRGLYRVDSEGQSYAFTQLEAISARLMFPSFDEPRFKTPFDVTVTARNQDTVVFTTAEESREVVGDLVTVRFRRTAPLPTYLLALAVGPLDVVEHAAIGASEVRTTPIPLHGIAARGHGSELAYALDNTGKILIELENYFGVPYAYEKLDIAAVPDFAAGAMENPGLVTFRDALLLFPDNVPVTEEQKQDYAYVMAHELAHQWFGNLVTMHWWDDIWLNEAFATWMGMKAVVRLWPEYRADLDQVSSVHRAMQQDSLLAARQIRQPIESSHDISNAFDSITYRKGGGVLSMFESMMAEEVFRTAMQSYMRTHAHGVTTYEDLLASLDAAAGRDVGTAFRTFLFQPGLPTIAMQESCENGQLTLALSQSRYLPIGVTEDASRLWQVPICVRTENGNECTLLTERTGTMTLAGRNGRCPSWFMPNSDADGYYRFTLSASALATLRSSGWRHLNGREQAAVVDSLRASVDAGTTDIDGILPGFAQLIQSDVQSVASYPNSILQLLRLRVFEAGARQAPEALARRLYAPSLRRLGWAARRNESSQQVELRQLAVTAMAETGQDPATRRKAAGLARRYLGIGGDEQLHPEAVDANLIGLVLYVAVEDGDAAIFDAVLKHGLAAAGAQRAPLMGALGAARSEELSRRALELSLDSRIRVNEIWGLLGGQFTDERTREAAWTFLSAHFDELLARMERGAGMLPYTTMGCSEVEAARTEAFFAPRVEHLNGGPRNLALALEASRACAARIAHLKPSAERFFATH